MVKFKRNLMIICSLWNYIRFQYALRFFLDILLLFMGYVYDHFPKQFFVFSSNEQFAGY